MLVGWEVAPEQLDATVTARCEILRRFIAVGVEQFSRGRGDVGL
jgi:hypothetical protein